MQDSMPFDVPAAASAFQETFNAEVSAVDDDFDQNHAVQYHEPERGIFDLPPLQGASMMVKGSNGRAKWITLAPAWDEDEDLDLQDRLVRRANQGMTLESINAEALALATAKAQAEAEEAAAESKHQETPRRELFQGGNESDSEALWVQKYTPKQFVELLSDEPVNLNLLRWLKAWEPYVFGSSDGEKAERPYD